MTHRTLTRAAIAIAIAALVLGVRANAQEGTTDDPVRAERARIEAAVTGVQQEELDRQLVQFVANALILGNVESVRDLGVAGVPALRSLALEREIGDLATYHENPIESIAYVAPMEAVATLRQALALSPRRFSALCAIEDGLGEIAQILAQRPDQRQALESVVDLALSGDGLTAAEREAIALASVKSGLRSSAIDAVAVRSAKLLEASGVRGALLRFETTGKLDPRYAERVMELLWSRDRAAALASAESEDPVVRRALAGVVLPADRSAPDPALDTLLRLVDDDDASVAEAAGARFYELASSSQSVPPAEALRGRIGLLIDRAHEGFLNSYTNEDQGSFEQLMKNLDDAAEDGSLVGLAAGRATSKRNRVLRGEIWRAIQSQWISTEAILAVWSASSPRDLDEAKRGIDSRVSQVSKAEGREILHRMLQLRGPAWSDFWRGARNQGALDALEGDMAALAVEVYASQPEADRITELLEVAATWSDCGPAMRSVAADAAKAPFERYLAVGCMLRSGSFVPTDAALVTEVLLAVDASDEVPWDRAYRIASNRYSLRDERARHMLADAIIRAWSARLDEGRPFRVVRMSSNLENAPQPLVDRFMALAARAYESPARAYFFEANGLAVVNNCGGADDPANPMWKLVEEAVAQERGSPHAFDKALELAFESAALQGALRAMSGGWFGSNDVGSREFVVRVVGLKSFRADPKHAATLAEALATSGKLELMKQAKEALDEIAALKEVAARISDPTVAADAAPDLRETLFQWITAGQADGADETAYRVGAIALQTLAELGDPRDRDYFRGLIGAPIYGMDSDAAAVMFKGYLASWSRR